MKKQLTAVALAAATLLSPLGAQAQTAADADSWKFSLMPYLWLPTIKTNLNFGPVAASRLESEISVAPDEWLRDLKMAALLAGEARYGNWLVGGDFVYMHLGDSGSKTKVKNFGPGPVQTFLNTDTDSSLKTQSVTTGIFGARGGSSLGKAIGSFPSPSMLAAAIR